MEARYLTRAELLAQGHTRWSLHTAVARGELVHIRRDRYIAVGAHDDVVRAMRVGGRLTCLSLLQALDVFVLANRVLHVQVEPTAGRLRSPQTTKHRLDRGRRHGTRLHWSSVPDAPVPSCVVPLVHALAHAVSCQSPRAAIATLDSALNKRLVTDGDLVETFHLLPARHQVLKDFVDGLAESGPETLVRLMARQLGCSVELQREFDGIGRVDLVLDGWLVVECDSKQFHSSWQAQVKDRERDLALAALGYSTLRLTAAAIMYRPDEVFAALRGLVASRSR